MTNQIKATYVDHAYAAGFLEADGCIHLPSSSTSIRVSNRNLDVLNWYKVRYGGQVIAKRNPEGCWEWTIHSQGAIDFLNLVYEHLVFKKPQADLLFEYFSTRQTRGVKLSEDVVLLRANIKNRMKLEKAQWRS